MKKAAIVNVISFLLIFLFAYAAGSKLLDFIDFKVQLLSFPLIPAIASWLVWIIPVSELITVVILSLPCLKLIGLYASTIILILFTIYIIAIMVFAKQIPCSCGGILQHLSWPEHVVFNLIFIALSIVGIQLKRKLNSTKNL